MKPLTIHQLEEVIRFVKLHHHPTSPEDNNIQSIYPKLPLGGLGIIDVKTNFDVKQNFFTEITFIRSNGSSKTLSSEVDYKPFDSLWTYCFKYLIGEIS